MPRGDLMQKLIASYGRDEEFRTVAEQIIGEEERKRNWGLAKSLRRTLESTAQKTAAPKPLAPLLPFPDAAADFVEPIEPQRNLRDIVLTDENAEILRDLLIEFRRGDKIRRHGLPIRSKLLLCGPPGCGKTLCAEVFASEIGLPFFVVKLDRVVSSYLGETATNLRKLFEFARKQPCVLFFDEFDALARARDDGEQHSELKRVVNSLLIFIDRMQPRGFIIAASNLDHALDDAMWRRFDEVLWFEKPNRDSIDRFLRMRFRNLPTEFDIRRKTASLLGYSFADINRICIQAAKSTIIADRTHVTPSDFDRAVKDEARRHSRKPKAKPRRRK